VNSLLFEPGADVKCVPKRRSEGAKRGGGGLCQYNIGVLFKWSESAESLMCFAVMAGSGLEYCAICAFVHSPSIRSVE
jgi:hypothetical protein